MPHLQKAYEKYRTDETVQFVLVSLDTDPKRLGRFMEERKFAMPIARWTQADAERTFNFNDIPATFYIDRSGVIRYETRGTETHGEAADRVIWYVEELKKP